MIGDEDRDIGKQESGEADRDGGSKRRSRETPRAAASTLRIGQPGRLDILTEDAKVFISLWRRVEA